jgi:PAS domain S-box-containing protein
MKAQKKSARSESFKSLSGGLKKVKRASNGEPINWDQFILGMKKTTKEFIENVLENIIESIVVANLDGYLVFFNKYSEEMFRYRAEEVLNRHIVILGAQKPDVLGTIRRGEPFNGEIILKRKGGHPFPAHVRCVPLRDERDRPIAMVGVARDLTAEKEKERIDREVARLQAFNKNIIASLNDGILIINLKGNIAFANKRLEELLGYEYRELLGMHCSELIVEEGRALFKNLISARADVRGRASFETSFVTRSGKKILCWISASPLIEGNTWTGMIAAVSDISEIQKLKEELFQSEKMSLIGTLSSEVAHEINNPLGGLVMSVQMLLRDIEAGELDLQLAREELSEIENDARRCKRITQKLLDFSRQVPDERNLLDVTRVIEDGLLLVQRQTEIDNIAIHKKYAKKLPMMHGNSNSLQQVIINLVKNARDVMPEGGEIIISTGIESMRERGKWIRISIADTGPGIDEEVSERLFNPFFTTKPGGKGTGLGLAVSKRIVEEHGGRLSFENSPTGGAVFHILLPAIAGNKKN